MNTDDIDEDKLFAQAREHEKKLAERAQFDMLRAGRTDTADALQDPRAQEMLARSALAKAILPMLPSAPTNKGPALRERPKVSHKKRQRQARKSNR